MDSFKTACIEVQSPIDSKLHLQPIVSYKPEFYVIFSATIWLYKKETERNLYMQKY